MEFYEYLINTYGYNEPILLSEISFNTYSNAWIAKEVGQLCKEEKIIRFEKGIYYIPTDTPLGKSKLDPYKVITKKYIQYGQETIGYYSGSTLLNKLGLSTQIPNTLEIFTNNEPSRMRKIQLGNQQIILRRSRITINNKNVATLSLLELMNNTNASFYDDEKRVIIANYLSKNGITRKTISTYSPFFPDKAMRTLIESEIIYSVAP